MGNSKVDKLKLIFAWLMIVVAMLACTTTSIESDSHISCKDHSFVPNTWSSNASNCTYTCDNGDVIPGVFDQNTPPETGKILLYCNPGNEENSVELDNGLTYLVDPDTFLIQSCNFTCSSGISVNVTEYEKGDLYPNSGFEISHVDEDTFEDTYCSVGSAPEPDDTHISCGEQHLKISSNDKIEIVNVCTYTCDNGSEYPETFDEFNGPIEEEVNQFCKTELGDSHISCANHEAKVDDFGNIDFFSSGCTYTCDNGSEYPNIFDELSKPSEAEINNFCKMPAASVVEDTAATEEPTEVPAPILTGDVTYCDIVSRSVNLRLVEGFAAEDFSHQVTIGGEAMSCKVNEGNATLLTCTFPATTKFPASIQVSKEGDVVNEFEYNGSNCVVPEQQAGPKDPGSGEETSSGSDCWDLYVPFGLCIPKP